MEPKKIFENGLLYHHYANTAYPLTPSSLHRYKIRDYGCIPEFLTSEWSKAEELSLYVHIPFCKVRCKFCEYTVLENTDCHLENLYVELLLKEIALYSPMVKNKPIVGYDLGGGTPTKLSAENIAKITNAIRNSFTIADGVTFSIETTPIIAAQEPEKIADVFRLGYKRISMGIQTVSERLLNELGREGTTHIYEQAVENIRRAGYTDFNIDLMYGFLHQSDEDFENTIRYAINLHPEHITLYRNRYKGTKIENEAGGVSLYKIICQYRLAYELLTAHGYQANPGKNTFSRVDGAYGTSDYLTKRVIRGTSYIGLGLGAQSFGPDYLAYNQGAATKQLKNYQEAIEAGRFPLQDVYALPLQETVAKMVSVAFYFGFVDLAAFKKRFGVDFCEYFKSETEFVLSEELMQIKEGRIWLTERGADYINGIIPLFYSDDSKQELLDLYRKSRQDTNGEKEFLKNYAQDHYERPSLTTDIVVFGSTHKKINRKKCSVVMIRRGEHPFMNSWALPGGFVQPGESAETAAGRELAEETGLTDVALSQLCLSSDPYRDPRGWIVSLAFVGLVNADHASVKFGSDAIDARLFNIHKKKISTRHEKREGRAVKSVLYRIKLVSDDICLSAEVKKIKTSHAYGTKIEYEIVTSDRIAFDHAKILMSALDR